MPAVMDEVHLLMTTLKWMTTHGIKAGRYVSGGYLNRACENVLLSFSELEGLNMGRTYRNVNQTKLFKHGRAEDVRGKLYTASRLYLCGVRWMYRYLSNKGRDGEL